MIELLVAKSVLSDILYENKTFKNALSDQCFSKKEHSNIRRVVTSLVGCELRHHFLLKKVLDKLNLKTNLDQRTTLYLALANNHFSRSLNVKNVNEHVKELFKENYSQIEFLLDEKLSLFEYLNINKKSFDYISIRFNLPKWLLKSFAKEVGLSTTYKIIRQIALPINPTYRKNPYNDKYAQLLEEKKDLLGEDIYPGIVEISKKTMKENRELQGEHLFEIDYRVKKVIDTMHNQFLEEVAVYSDEDDSLPLELLASSKGKLGINVVCPTYDSRTNLIRSIRLQKKRNINVFKANDLISMKTGISRDVELFYCFPKSSSYSFINKYPDYIVRFRNNQIDALVENQKKSIELCSEFVCDGGELIYLVNTLDERETKQVIHSFLDKHPEFEIVREKQFLPEEKCGGFLYAACLKKVAKHG